jgi:hypothetical protein
MRKGYRNKTKSKRDIKKQDKKKRDQGQVLNLAPKSQKEKQMRSRTVYQEKNENVISFLIHIKTTTKPGNPSTVTSACGARM